MSQTSLTVHVTSLELSVHVFMYLLIVRDIKVRGVDTGTEYPVNLSPRLHRAPFVKNSHSVNIVSFPHPQLQLALYLLLTLRNVVCIYGTCI